MRGLVAGLGLIVAVEYALIALAVVPGLARLAMTKGPLISVARWGAAAFFLGCAVTHTMIAVDAVLAAPSSGMHEMTGVSGCCGSTSFRTWPR